MYPDVPVATNLVTKTRDYASIDNALNFIRDEASRGSLHQVQIELNMVLPVAIDEPDKRGSGRWNVKVSTYYPPGAPV